VEFDSKIGSLQTNMDVLRTDVKTEITSVRSSMDSNFANILARLPAPVAATPAPAATPRPTTNPRGIEQDDGWVSEEEMDTALDQPLMAPSFITQQEMERTVNMGNPVFQSYGFVTKQVKEALAERAEEDKSYGNVAGGVHAPFTAEDLQKQGLEQKKAFKRALEKIVWNGQVPILEWVQWICDALADHSLTSVTHKEQKSCIWGAIHPSKQQELTHIRPRTAAFINDSLPEYVARVVSVYEPEIFSEKYRQAYQNRKQLRQESATRYMASKWFHYTRAEPTLNWPNFVRDTINGLVCFRLKSRLYQKLEKLKDLGKFQGILYKEIMLIRRDIQDPAGDGGSLAGLKVTQYDANYGHDTKGTLPMETNAVEEPDMDYGTEDLEVAVVERRNGCFNCGKLGHIRAQCNQPKQQEKQEPPKRKESQQAGIDTCTRCKKTGHTSRQCVCLYCMRTGHSVDKCYKKERDAKKQTQQAGFQ